MKLESLSFWEKMYKSPHSLRASSPEGVSLTFVRCVGLKICGSPKLSANFIVGARIARPQSGQIPNKTADDPWSPLRVCALVRNFAKSPTLLSVLKKAFPLSGKRMRCSRKAALFLCTALKKTDASHPTPHPPRSSAPSPQGEGFRLCGAVV